MRTTPHTPKEMEEEVPKNNWREGLDRRRWSDVKMCLDYLEGFCLASSTNKGRILEQLAIVRELDTLRGKRQVAAYMKDRIKEDKQRKRNAVAGT